MTKDESKLAISTLNAHGIDGVLFKCIFKESAEDDDLSKYGIAIISNPEITDTSHLPETIWKMEVIQSNHCHPDEIKSLNPSLIFF